MSVSARKGSPAVMIVGIIVAVIGATALASGAIFLLVGGVFAVVFPAVFGTPMNDLQLNKHGVVCSGELIAVEPNPNLTVNNRPTVRLRYDYDAAGLAREGDILVKDTDPLATLPVGSPVTVEYLPDDPDVSRIQGGKAAVAGWAGAFGLGFGGIGLLAVAGSLILALFGVGLALFGARRMRVRA